MADAGRESSFLMRDGDALELVQSFEHPIDLLVSDPPYAFGGAGGEHAGMRAFGFERNPDPRLRLAA